MSTSPDLPPQVPDFERRVKFVADTRTKINQLREQQEREHAEATKAMWNHTALAVLDNPAMRSRVQRITDEQLQHEQAMHVADAFSSARSKLTPRGPPGEGHSAVTTLAAAMLGKRR